MDAQNDTADGTYKANVDVERNLDVGGTLDVGGASAFGGNVKVSHGSNPTLTLQETANRKSWLQDKGTAALLIVSESSDSAAVINVDPDPTDGASTAKIRCFREITVTTGPRRFEIYKGDGSTNVTFEVDASNGNVMSKGDLEAQAGDVVAGTDGGARGVVTAWDGSGGSAPGCLKLASPNGTVWYLFVEDDGTVKVHSALPALNSDGTEVGSQT